MKSNKLLISVIVPVYNAEKYIDKCIQSIISQTYNKINMCRFGNSMVLDIKFSPKFYDEKDNQKALINMVKTYFDNGGMEIQFNVIDADTLRKAQEKPNEYRNIIVRVAGFSARFVGLSKKLQDEIISRTENVSC